MKFDCFTCRNTCDEEYRKECMDLKYVWWSPKNRELCKNCKVGNENRCYRHAEPCFLREDIYGKEMELIKNTKKESD